MARTEIPLVVFDPTTGDLLENAEVTVIDRIDDVTLATVYTAETGVGTETQPLTSDAQGRVAGWLDRGQYRFDVEPPGGGAVFVTESFDSATAEDGSIDDTWLASDSVTEAKILDGAVTTDKIDDDAVTTAKILNANVTEGKIATGAVTNTKIGTGAVDANKLASNAVTSAKILDGEITNADISTTAEIDGTKLASSFLAKAGIDGSSTVRRGKFISSGTPGEGTRTSTSYGTLTGGDAPGPDQVSNVVLPTNGLIVVAYQALWKDSVADAGRAAIFVGATQLKEMVSTTPEFQEAALIDNASPNSYTTLSTFGFGLQSPLEAVGVDSSQVTTGQLVGAGTDGGPCYIFAAAGTYTISVQFKATSGTVTAKERKLWVWTMGF